MEMQIWMILAPYQDWVLLLARIVIGVTFLYYGLPKIKNLKSNADDFDNMGFKPGMFWGTIVALLETAGSLLLILGIYTWLIAGLIAGHMLVGTIWKITKVKKPFTDWSYDVLILVIALILLVFGGGIYTIL